MERGDETEGLGDWDDYGGSVLDTDGWGGFEDVGGADVVVRPNMGLEAWEVSLIVGATLVTAVALLGIWRETRRHKPASGKSRFSAGTGLAVGTTGWSRPRTISLADALLTAGADRSDALATKPAVETDETPFDWRIVWIVVTYGIHSLAAYGMLRISLPYLVEDVAGSRDSRIMGMLAASGKVSQFVSNLLIGQLSDRYGRRPTFLVCYVGSGVSCLFMALAAEFQLGVWLVIVGVVVNGLSNAMVSTTSAALCDITSERDRTRMLGMLSVMVSFGTFVGPLTFDFIAARFGLTAVYFFMSGLYTLGVALHLTIRETLPPHLRSTRRISVNPVASLRCLRGRPILQLLCFIGGFMAVAEKFFMTLFVYFATERFGVARASIAWMLSMHGLVGALNQGLLVQLAVRVVTDYFIISAGTLLSCVANILLFLARDTQMVWGSTMIRSLADSTYGPVLYSITSKAADPLEVGQTLSALKTITIMGDVTGSQVSGMLFHHLNSPDTMQFVFLIAAVFAGLSFLTTLVLHRHRPVPVVVATTTQD